MTKPKVQLYGLSHKADERNIAILNSKPGSTSAPRIHVLRKKEEDMSHFKSPVRKNQATAVNKEAVTRKGAYSLGDGDFGIPIRIGADDHKKFKSLSSLGVAIYGNRGHK